MIRDGWKVATGLLLFLGVVTWPAWKLAFGTEPVPVDRPTAGNCVEPLAQIRADHPVILARWRDEVVRGGSRTIVIDGVEREKSLENVCMDCHPEPGAFCDRCHETSNVVIDCWDCHLRKPECTR